MSKQDGGSAFPIKEDYSESQGRYLQYASDGMSLRDYFAAHSNLTIADAVNWLAGIGNIKPTGLEIMQGLATMKFMYADSMIAERNKEI